MRLYRRGKINKCPKDFFFLKKKFYGKKKATIFLDNFLYFL